MVCITFVKDNGLSSMSKCANRVQHADTKIKKSEKKKIHMEIFDP